MMIIPDVPVVYTDTFPENFINDVNGWGSFSKQILQDNRGKLLSLDIDFGDRCSLNCPHCFRKNNRVDFPEVPGKRRRLMKYDDILEVVEQGKELGLRSVKFLGAGEPFEHERFLEFLRVLKKLNIVPSIFTKGHVIGNDKLVKKYYSHYGISTGMQLVEELKKVNASILLGFNSFDAEIQDMMVGGVKGYTIKRNRALELLARAGFNKNNPTHLCLAINPVTKENYAEVFEIYTWGRVRNLYAIVCPTMVSGRCGEPHAWQSITPTGEEMIDLYTKIYEFNIQKGIQTLKQIKDEQVSAYAGGHPCNQIACGMYVTLTGTVLRCPGDDTTRLGNIWQDKMKDIWFESENYRRSGSFNCDCPPKKGKTIPYNLYREVLARLERTQSNNARA